MEYIINFFNFTLPCPGEIPDCERLRIEYMDELNGLKRRGGCSKCAENSLKNKFIVRIQGITKK